MKIVVFGLTISSSWGNGHATLWRGLCKALARMGHTVVFFERDVEYYAATRDWQGIAHCELVLYADWPSVAPRARLELRAADVAIVTSYCPDARAATQLMLDASRPVTLFYDLDTPVTLAELDHHGCVAYIGERGLADFDLVLSYTGGPALCALERRLGARRVATLYGHADPETHCAVAGVAAHRCALSYLGTYAADRQAALAALFVEPARARPTLRFLIAGAQYPGDFPWSPNIYFVRHLAPSGHAAFFCSSRLTLNVTRRAMATMGWCPSGRLFEAAACGTAVLSDAWCGLESFYAPGHEILVARTTEDVLAALELDDHTIGRIACAARERTLDEHTSRHRAARLVALIEDLRCVDRRHAPSPAAVTREVQTGRDHGEPVRFDPQGGP